MAYVEILGYQDILDKVFTCSSVNGAVGQCELPLELSLATGDDLAGGDIFSKVVRMASPTPDPIPEFGWGQDDILIGCVDSLCKGNVEVESSVGHFGR